MLRQVRTFIRLCDGDTCPAYLIPERHLHPQPSGRPLADTLLSDPVHAGDEARSAGWLIGVEAASQKWIDLCPSCGPVWEAEQKRSREGKGTAGTEPEAVTADG